MFLDFCHFSTFIVSQFENNISYTIHHDLDELIELNKARENVDLMRQGNFAVFDIVAALLGAEFHQIKETFSFVLTEKLLSANVLPNYDGLKFVVIKTNASSTNSIVTFKIL